MPILAFDDAGEVKEPFFGTERQAVRAAKVDRKDRRVPGTRLTYNPRSNRFQGLDFCGKSRIRPWRSKNPPGRAQNSIPSSLIFLDKGEKVSRVDGTWVKT